MVVRCAKLVLILIALLASATSKKHKQTDCEEKKFKEDVGCKMQDTCKDDVKGPRCFCVKLIWVALTARPTQIGGGVFALGDICQHWYERGLLNGEKEAEKCQLTCEKQAFAVQSLVSLAVSHPDAINYVEFMKKLPENCCRATAGKSKFIQLEERVSQWSPSAPGSGREGEDATLVQGGDFARLAAHARSATSRWQDKKEGEHTLGDFLDALGPVPDDMLPPEWTRARDREEEEQRRSRIAGPRISGTNVSDVEEAKALLDVIKSRASGSGSSSGKEIEADEEAIGNLLRG